MSSKRINYCRRILVLVKGLGIGGAEKLITTGATQWNRDEFDYRVAYVLPWKNQLVGELAATGTLVDCVGGSTGFDLLTPRRLRELARDWTPDLIHAHLPTAGILARVSTRVPVIYTEHNIVDSYRQPTRTLNRLTYGRNRAVIAVSDAVAESLKRYPGPKPVMIPNGVPTATSGTGTPNREELGLARDIPLVVHVGNIRPHKGHSNLVAATALLTNDIPEVMVVSIGGEKQAGDLDRVRAEAEEAGVAENIRFLGRREDARSFMATADVVVNPSDVEGLPLAILEALSLSRPVVATDVGGVSSVVVDEKTGLLVPPGDPSALAQALFRALSSPEASVWGRAGAVLVEREHSTAKMIEEYESVYRKVLND